MKGDEAMSLTDYERETIINMNDGEPIARIYTAQRRVITRLKNNPAAVLVDEGTHEGSVWARFTIPAELVSFRSVRRQVELTDEQRQARSEAMRELRERGKLGSAKTA
jgi:hypothetical protein